MSSINDLTMFEDEVVQLLPIAPPNNDTESLTLDELSDMTESLLFESAKWMDWVSEGLIVAFYSVNGLLPWNRDGMSYWLEIIPSLAITAEELLLANGYDGYLSEKAFKELYTFDQTRTVVTFADAVVQPMIKAGPVGTMPIIEDANPKELPTDLVLLIQI